MLLKPRTPLQKRDAVYKPLIPPSRRVMASTDKTSFLNKRVERYGKDIDERLGEKVEQMLKGPNLERKMTESEGKNKNEAISKSNKVEPFYFQKLQKASPNKFYLKEPLIDREFSENKQSLGKSDITIHLTPSLENETLSASSEKGDPSDQSRKYS